MIYLYLITFILILLSFRKRKDSIFTPTLTRNLKGFFAICVLINHIGLYSHLDGGLAVFNNNLGGIAVGAFFMLSAVGLGIRYSQEPDTYPRRILLIKTPALYIIQVIINCIYFFVNKPELTLTQTLLSIFNLDIFFNLPRLNGYSWFITTILFIYILLAVSFILARKFKNKKLFIGLFNSIILSGASLFLYFDPLVNLLYIRALMCFSLGLWYALYFDAINGWLSQKKVFIWSTILTSTAMIVLSIVSWLEIANTEYVLSLMTCWLIITLAQKLELKNPILTFVGSIALEFYLLQMLTILNVTAVNTLVWGVAVFGTTLILAFVFHIVYKQIAKLCSYLVKKLFFKNKISE